MIKGRLLVKGRRTEIEQTLSTVGWACCFSAQRFSCFLGALTGASNGKWCNGFASVCEALGGKQAGSLSPIPSLLCLETDLEQVFQPEIEFAAGRSTA
jgi:hypothetical protein